MKQRQLISKLNMVCPAPIDFLSAEYGETSIQRLLAKGLLSIDKHGYCRLTDSAFQLNVRFA